jgi:DUF4097 and DUF4098 domain-containing protein YvlB
MSVLSPAARRLCLLAALLPALAVAAPKSIDKVNGAIRTEAGTEYGDLETVNGSIRVAEGVVARSVETVNGSVAVDRLARVDSVETVNGSIQLRADASVDGAAETVNGSITLDAGSAVQGRVETVNGGIRLVQARIGGGIETVNGDIDVLDGSRVSGGIVMRKPSMGWFNNNTSRVPKVTIGANSVVEGRLVFEREVELCVHPTARIGPVEGATVKTLGVER